MQIIIHGIIGDLLGGFQHVCGTPVFVFEQIFLQECMGNAYICINNLTMKQGTRQFLPVHCSVTIFNLNKLY